MNTIQTSKQHASTIANEVELSAFDQLMARLTGGDGNGKEG